MKTKEDILSPLRGTGRFINCVDYDDALKAMEEYCNQPTGREAIEAFKKSFDRFNSSGWLSAREAAISAFEEIANPMQEQQEPGKEIRKTLGA